MDSSDYNINPGGLVHTVPAVHVQLPIGPFQCKRLHDDAQLPRWNEGDAGYDIYSIETIRIGIGERVLADSGIAVRIPDGWVGFVKPRSGMAVQGITTDAGVIDASYRGELKILLKNTNRVGIPNRIEKGTRIAQLVILPCFSQPPTWVEELDETVRGAGGFGSTGTK